jgi:hypothetical protein
MEPFSSVARVLKGLWIWARRIFWTLVIISIVVLVLEGIHLHTLLATLHPALAWVVTGLLLGAGGLVGAWAAWRWWRVPRALDPPELPAPDQGWTDAQRRAYLSFARLYLEQQSQNPALPRASISLIPEAQARLEGLRGEADPVRLVEAVENEIDEVLEPLDREARQEIWRAASEVAVLTAVNPSALMDVLITLLRNLDLLARLATLYGGRPGIAVTVRITRDVLAMAVTAGILDRLAESASSVAADVLGSWSSRLAGPVGQGLVNGLLTIRLGDAAVARCRSLRSRRVTIKPWSRATWREMARRLSRHVSGQLAPELARAFRDAGRGAREQSGGAFRRAFDWLRGSRKGSEEPEPPEPT